MKENKMRPELVKYQLNLAKGLLKDQKEIFVVFFKSFLETESSTIQSFKKFSELYKMMPEYTQKGKGIFITIYIVTENSAELILFKDNNSNYFKFCNHCEKGDDKTIDDIFKVFENN